LAGWVADTFGTSVAFLFLAFTGLAAVAAVWLAMPETRPMPPLARKPAMLAA